MVTEAARIATLHSYAVMDTPEEPEFTALVARIATTFSVRSAVISFIDDNRQWYKARYGVDGTSVPRVQSLCTHILESDDTTVLPDARQHPTFRDNIHVACEGGVRFYAAAPIKALNRARLGTVCLFDPRPRPEGMSERERRQLSSFAAQVVELLEQRRNVIRGRAAGKIPAVPPLPSAG
ncbi:GAF domain-containing protein [Sphingomonas floccifaciens]|uniref:GAF domain-containing protein n=1 Tax=Sphingomonas floccifaciens TaxID=1844115 RepID=A0ABW4NGC5_9SPHN